MPVGTLMNSMGKVTAPHRPPHVYADNTWYIITASTANGMRYLITDDHLRLWVEIIRELIEEFGITLRAWVVMSNHYHVLLKSRAGRDVGKFLGRLNGRTSYEFNLLDKTKGRQVWYNYWDTCIRSEADYWTRFNYIHNNPVKHRYVQHPADWEFSSYRHYLRTKGEEWLADCWQRYPVIDFLEGDDF
jgi:putative transposase